MQSRRKVLMIVVAVLLIAFFVAACVLLVLRVGDFRQADGRLAGSKARLDYLYGWNPFPSEYNLRVERKNLIEREGQLAGLVRALREGQVESAEQNPAKFSSQFWAAHKRLLDIARKEGIVITGGGDFSFGFERYMKGELPAAARDVPRLTQQLRIMQTLCGVLFDAKIASLQGIGREEFEGDAAASPKAEEPKTRERGRRRLVSQVSMNAPNANAGLVPADQLYGAWHFVFAFTAREKALFDVLNGLACCPVFVEVTDLNLSSPEKGLSLAPEGAVGKAESPERSRRNAPKEKDPESNEEPAGAIICGHDLPLTIRMEVDVYQFANYPVSNKGDKVEVPK